MTTDYHIDSPDYDKVPAHWWRAKEGNFYLIEFPGGVVSVYPDGVSDAMIGRICHAFNVESLALNYAQAKHAMDNAQTAADIEAMRSVYADAARALCEAVR